MGSLRYRPAVICDSATAKMVSAMVGTMLLERKEAAIMLHGNMPEWVKRIDTLKRSDHKPAASCRALGTSRFRA